MRVQVVGGFKHSVYTKISVYKNAIFRGDSRRIPGITSEDSIFTENLHCNRTIVYRKSN